MIKFLIQRPIAVLMYLASYWQYRTFKAGRLPSLSLNLTPAQYYRYITRRYDSENDIDVYRKQQSFYAGGGLTVTQNFDPLGGTFTLNSDLSYIRNFGSNTYSQYTSVPFSIGYSQDLFGYNAFKWERRIEPLKYEAAKRTLLYNMEELSEQAATYFFALAMAEEDIQPSELFGAMQPVFNKNLPIGSIVVDNETEKLKLSSRQSDEYDIWSMENAPLIANDRTYKLSELATVEKGQMPQKIAKENQQYRLCLQYEYIGASSQGEKIQKNVLDDFNKILPMGYTAESESNYWGWEKKDNKQYLLLLLIIVIIFFTTSILFNSLKQPLAVIFVIPISYIGVFLTFYWFKLNFDQGGFASFVLLCGITVNASIYILNEYNQIRENKPLMYIIL